MPLFLHILSLSFLILTICIFLDNVKIQMSHALNLIQDYSGDLSDHSNQDSEEKSDDDKDYHPNDLEIDQDTTSDTSDISEEEINDLGSKIWEFIKNIIEVLLIMKIYILFFLGMRKNEGGRSPNYVLENTNNHDDDNNLQPDAQEKYSCIQSGSIDKNPITLNIEHHIIKACEDHRKFCKSNGKLQQKFNHGKNCVKNLTSGKI